VQAVYMGGWCPILCLQYDIGGRGGEYCVLYLGTKDIGICLGIFWQLVDQ